jgi:hypothetical protein
MNSSEKIRSVPVLLPSRERLVGKFLIWEQAPDNQDAVRLELHFADKQLAATAEGGFFEALISIRKQLEPEGIRVLCHGCSRDVFPSPMIGSMGYGEKAYRLEIGRPARSADIVSIFDTAPGVNPATVAEQEQFYREWLRSIGVPSARPPSPS